MPRSRSPDRKRYSRSRSYSPRRHHSGGRHRRSRSPAGRLRRSRSRGRKPHHKSPWRPSDHRSRSKKSRSPHHPRSRSRGGSSSASSERSPRRKLSRAEERKKDYDRSPHAAKQKHASSNEATTQRPMDRFQPAERARTPVDVRLDRLAAMNSELDEKLLYTEHEPIRQPLQKEAALLRSNPMDDNYGIGELDYDEEMPAHNTPPPASYGRREEVLLSERFRDPQQQGHNPDRYQFQENITVDIRRKVKEASPEEIRRDFNVASVLQCIHRKGEGEKPIFAREEIALARLAAEREEVVEKRVVSMAPSKSSSRSFPEDFSVSRDSHVSSRLFSDQNWGSHIAQAMMSNPRVSKEPVIHRITDNLRYGDVEELYSSSDRRPGNPNDLRNALLRRRQDSGRERSPVFDARQKISSSHRSDQPLSHRLGHGSSKQEITSGHRDRRNKLSGRSSSGDRHGGSRDRRDSSQHGGDDGRGSKSDIQRKMLGIAAESMEVPTKEGAPDFSRRPNKGTYEAWKTDPTQTPIGEYFEHDNRDGKGSFRGRGRGRGFVPRGRGRGFINRGRGSYGARGRGTFVPRGSSYRRDDGGRDERDDDRSSRHHQRESRDYRSRDYRSRDSSRAEPEWKHDKFKELLEEEDSKPHSTTKT